MTATIHTVAVEKASGELAREQQLAWKLAELLASGPPLVYAALKEIVREAEDMKFQDALNRIKKEISTFELRIGVVNHTLMQAKLRQRPNERSVREKPVDLWRNS